MPKRGDRRPSNYSQHQHIICDARRYFTDNKRLEGRTEFCGLLDSGSAHPVMREVFCEASRKPNEPAPDLRMTADWNGSLAGEVAKT
jgi:hypothetical protein